MKPDWIGIASLVVLAGAALGAWQLGAEDLAQLFAAAAVGGAVLPRVWRRGERASA